MFLKLVVTTLVIQMALGTTISTVNVDFTASIAQANLPLLENVVTTIDINYPFAVLNTNQWSQFHDLTRTFTLPYAQKVKFTYNINIGSAGDCLLATKLMIDGKEERIFRAHTAYTVYNNLSRYGQVLLEKGEHHAQVYYRSSCYSFTNYPDWDWPAGIFRVDYYRFKST